MSHVEALITQVSPTQSFTAAIELNGSHSSLRPWKVTTGEWTRQEEDDAV